MNFFSTRHFEDSIKFPGTFQGMNLPGYVQAIPYDCFKITKYTAGLFSSV